MTHAEQYKQYLLQLRTPFKKLCRLRFLQPDGSTAFALDNNASRRSNRTFIASGDLSVNLQNGQRRTAEVTLQNVNGDFDYNVNKIWFGQEIALDEGLLLPDGTEFYIPQGVFLAENPAEAVNPTDRVMTYSLVDKWANIDGTLYGALGNTHEVYYGANIYEPIAALLAEDKGNGRPVDRMKPVFTEYYNDKTQTLPDGTVVNMTDCPYTISIDGENGTIADVVLELAGVVNAWVGYDQFGQLRLDPSQDDITDDDKPVLWQFSQNETELLGMTYTVKNTEVYNDYIVVGEGLSDTVQPRGRVQNLDPRSDTNINLIGRKTHRENAAGFATETQCIDLATWRLKRATALKKAVTISCSQLFHISENNLVTIVRTDKPGNPVERHLIQGFSRPLASAEAMTISCVSVNDLDIATTITD